MTWIDAASNVLASASADPNAIPIPKSNGDPNSFIAHITLTLVAIVLGGIGIILAQSYLGRRRHSPEWIDQLEAAEAARNKERLERRMERDGTGVADIDRETTRDILERVAQLRGIGNAAATPQANERRPLSLEEAIESARRAPAKFEESEPADERPLEAPAADDRSFEDLSEDGTSIAGERAEEPPAIAATLESGAHLDDEDGSPAAESDAAESPFAPGASARSASSVTRSGKIPSAESVPEDAPPVVTSKGSIEPADEDREHSTA